MLPKMNGAVMGLHTIRRFGADVYRYRKEALALRAQTRTEFFRIAGRVFRPVILAIVAGYLSRTQYNYRSLISIAAVTAPSIRKFIDGKPS